MSFLSSILNHLKARCDDDIVDRLNYYYTTTLMILFAVLVSAKQYVGYPIQCWVPARFTEAMEQYTENYCWVQNTWWHALDEDIPKTILFREAKQLVYYQWVPFILAFDAILFYVPAFVWRSLNWQSGIYIEEIVQMARDSRMLVDSTARLKAIITTSHYLQDALTINKCSIRQGGHRAKQDKRSLFSAEQPTSRREMYVTSVYFGVKLMYCMNLFLQYFLLDFFLGTGELLYGPRLLYSLIHGKKGFQWQGTGLFPRVTLCDFEVKVMGNLHRHTVQCVLMINMFNEKIFLLLWFWFAILLLVTIGNLIYWLFISLLAKRREKFVLKYMRIGQIDYIEAGENALKDFMEGFLKMDGIFVLRLIGAHAGDIIVTEILAELWYTFLLHSERKPKAKYRKSSMESLASGEANGVLPIDLSAGDSAAEDEQLQDRRRKSSQVGGVASINRDPTSKLSDSGTQWAVAGSRILQKQVLNPMPIYKQHRFLRMEKKKGQY